MARSKVADTVANVCIVVGLIVSVLFGLAWLFGEDASKQQAKSFCETKFWKVESVKPQLELNPVQELLTVRLIPAKYVKKSGGQHLDKKGFFHEVDDSMYVFESSEGKEVKFGKNHPDWYSLPEIFKTGAVIRFWCLTPEKKEARGNWTNYLSPLSLYLSTPEK